MLREAHCIVVSDTTCFELIKFVLEYLRAKLARCPDLLTKLEGYSIFRRSLFDMSYAMLSETSKKARALQRKKNTNYLANPR